MPLRLWNGAGPDFFPGMRVPHASRSVNGAAPECEGIVPIDLLVIIMVEACFSTRNSCLCQLSSVVFRYPMDENNFMFRLKA